MAFIGKKNQDGSFWEPGTGDRVCSDHFISKAKSDVPNDPEYVPSVQVVQDLGRDQAKPCHDQANHLWVNNDAIARFERIKHRHSMQQANEKDRRLQADELHRDLQIVNHDHTYCSNKNNPTQPALVVTETEWQKEGMKKVYSTGIPCEVGKLVNNTSICTYK